jgi:hypothetical protein
VSLPLCKVFGPDEDQVVFLRVQNEEGEPAVDMYYDPQVDGVANVKIGLSYDTEGDRDAAFEQLTAETGLWMRDQSRAGVQKMFA